MLLSHLLLLALPLANARPHLPGAGAAEIRRREHHARAAVTDRPLVERAGGAISNETRDEISAWNHEHESVSQSVVTSASTANGVAGVGTALTAVSSAADSAVTPTSAAQTQTPVSEADVASAAEPSVVDVASSQAPEPSTAEAAAASPSPAASSVETSSEPVSSESASTRSSITHTTVVTASRSSTVVRVTASSSASAAAAKNDDEPEKIAGLSKTTFIIIIVVAGVIVLAAVGWTVFRKWKLRPSSRFDEKMRPIDFSPDNGADPLYMDEKAHQHHMRTGSNSSAAMHRQELVAELDSKHVPGVPDHDFTAGGLGAGSNMAGQGAYDVYNSDPYAHAEAYEYDAAYHYDQRGYEHDQPTQDTGYADLQRGNSIGSGSGHGHGQQYPIETFPVADHYLSRSTADGPYASAHRY